MAAPVAASIEARQPAANRAIERWELHSELALVSPEVRKRALDLLPERDPDAFLSVLRDPASSPAAVSDTVALAPDLPDPASSPAAVGDTVADLPVAVVGYALWRLAETARSAVVSVVGVVTLALLAELLH